MTDQSVEHYARLAPTYNEHWSYDPDYVRRLSDAMAESLRLIPSDVIADVGCGTGLYTRRLAEDLRPTHPVLCVDPVPAMLDQLPASSLLTPLVATAEDLAARRVAVPGGGALDAILLKESVHHVTDRRATLDGLVGLLSPHGRVLVVMLPRTIHHPLFAAAHERFSALQPDPADIEAMLRDAGLRASTSSRTFHAVIEREKYIHMLESRYMSVLREFSDDELSAGIDQFRRAYRDPVLRFDDRFAFVSGWVRPG